MRLSWFAFCAVVATLMIASRPAACLEYSNSCTIQSKGCHFRLVLADRNCMVQDEGTRRRPSRESGGEVLEGDDDNDHDGGELDIVPVKSLEKLEGKLTKMMEALSVRSLRHMRNIKADLRHMTDTINLLRMKNGKKNGRAGECPPEFLTVGTWSSCYRFSTFNATWHEAREYCSAVGANLISLDTLKEAYIMDYLIKSTLVYQLPKGWWTSGNYIVRNRKWMWTSKHHLKPVEFSRWAPGEPEARSTMHCLMLYKEARYMWHDAMCTDKHNFICEIELV